MIFSAIELQGCPSSAICCLANSTELGFNPVAMIALFQVPNRFTAVLYNPYISRLTGIL